MAAQEEMKLLIDVELEASKALANQQALKQALEDAKNELKRLKDAEGEMSQAYILQEANVKQLNTQLSANSKVLVQISQDTGASAGAYSILNKEAADATKYAKDMAVAYGANNEKTKEATKKAFELQQQLKDVDASVNQHQRNVGNYGNALEQFGGRFGSMIQNVENFTTANGGLSGSFKAGGQAVAGMGKQLLSLLANPIVAIIAAIAGAVMLMVSAMKSNGEATNKFNQIIAPLKGLLNGIMTVIGGVVNILLTGVGAVMGFANAIMSVIPGLKGVSKATQDLVDIEKERQALAEENRQEIVNDARDEAAIADLKAKITRADLYSNKERLAFAKKADAIAKEMARDDVDRAERAYAIKLRQMKVEGKEYKDLTAEEKTALKEAEAEKYRVKKAYSESTRKINSNESKLNLQIIADEKKKVEDAEKAKADAITKAIEDKKKSQDNEVKDMELSLSLMKEKSILTSTQIFDEEKKILDKKQKYRMLSQKEYLLALATLEKQKVEADKATATASAEAEAKRLKDNADAALAALDYELKMTKLKNDERRAGQKLTDDQLYAQKLSDIDAAYQEELNKLKIKEDEEKTINQASLKTKEEKAIEDANITAKYDADEALAYQTKLTNRALTDAEYEKLRQENKAIAAATDLQNEMAIAESQNQSLYDLKIKQLEADRLVEIAAAEKTGADVLLIDKKYTAAKKKLAIEEISAKMSLASDFAGNIAEIFGKETKVGKMAASAQIAIDTAKGAMAAFTSMQSIPIVGLPLGIAAAGAVIAQGVKSIKDVWAVKSGLPGDNGGGGAAPISAIGAAGSEVASIGTGAVSNITGSVVARQSGSAQQEATTNAISEAIKFAPQPVLVTNDLTTALNNKIKLKTDNSI